MPLSAEEVFVAELDKFAQTLEPRLRAAFLEAVTKLRASLTDEELLHMVTTGDVTPILSQLDLGPFQHVLRSAVIEAAGLAMPGLPMVIRLDVFNPMVRAAMLSSELKTLKVLQTEVVQGVKQAITAGLQAGVNPVETARALRPLVGLTPKQVQSVSNYRQLLTGGAKGQPYSEALTRATRDARHDRTILRAIQQRVPLKPEQVDQQVKRFEERLLKRRAETIARTESISALWKGQHMQWRQAIENGTVQEDTLVRYWHVAKDERVCPICASIPGLNEDGVAFEAPFDTPDGPVMGPAAHPNCRCVVFVKFRLVGELP